MSKFLCPKTGEQCDFAQVTGEVVGTELQRTFRTAAVKVAQLGYMANLEMSISRQSIDDIKKFEQYAGRSSREDSVRVLKTALEDTTREMLPVFIDCGAGSEVECKSSEDTEAQRESVAGSLLSLTTKIVNNFNPEVQ